MSIFISYFIVNTIYTIGTFLMVMFILYWNEVNVGEILRKSSLWGFLATLCIVTTCLNMGFNYEPVKPEVQAICESHGGAMKLNFKPLEYTCVVDIVN